MEHISLQQLVLLLVIALLVFGTDSSLRRGTHDDVLSRLWEELQRLIFGTHWLLRRGRRVGGLSRLHEELQRHMPVYSAETIKGNEAEFIRDRLPKRFPIVIGVLAVLLFGAAWWLSR